MKILTSEFLHYSEHRWAGRYIGWRLERLTRESYIFVSAQLQSTVDQSALDANIYVDNKRVTLLHLDADSVNGVGNKFSGINDWC